MYLDFYGLKHRPFNMTPDPAFLFLTRQHREALAGLTYAILDRKGFLVLTGMAGSGKTTLLAWVLQKLSVSRMQSSVILNPTLTPNEFLEMAMLDFGLTDIPASKAQRLWMLQGLLLRGREQGKANVLIVDEAHKLSPEVLEEIRLLGNFENADDKLLQILLVGQSELDETLQRPELFQLKQRIGLRLSLEPLSAGEVEHYIAHRWRTAGGALPVPFTAGAVARIAEFTKGIPRLINSLCDNALMAGLAESAASISSRHVDSAAADLKLIDRPSKAPLVPPVAVNGTPKPYIPTLMATMDGYAKRPHRSSRLVRWAGKLGLAQ
jgi:general secretion pathway protein A